jgi:hypothetical protein
MSSFTSQALDTNPSSSGSAMDKTRDYLLSMEGITYVKPMEYSSVIQRTFLKLQTDRDTYKGGDDISMVLNTGEYYVHGKTSFAKFRLSIIGQDALLNGVGALGVMESVILTHASGTQISHNRNLNHYNYLNSQYDSSSDYHTKARTMSGRRTDGTYNTVNTVDAGTHIDVIIPLSEINGLFDQTKLLPAQLMSMMRLQIGLEKDANAFEWSGAGGSYTLSKFEIWLDCVQLSDVVLNKLQNIAASDGGLVYSFNDYVHNSTTCVGTNVILSSRSKLAQVNHVFAQSRIIEDGKEDVADNFSSEPWVAATTGWNSYSYSYGGINLPSNSSISDPVSQYYFALWSYSLASERKDTTNVSYDDYVKSKQIVAANLQRTNSALSGLPVEGSRSIDIRGSFPLSVAANYTRYIDLYVSYVTLIKIFSNNIMVKA